MPQEIIASKGGSPAPGSGRHITIKKKKFKVPPEVMWRTQLDYWRSINLSSDDFEVVPIPLEKGKKCNHHTLGDRGGPILTKNGAWTWDKLNHIVENKKLFSVPADVGIAISGAIGVLDFDCTKAWEWFNTKFKIDLSQYIVVQGKSKSHECGCEGEYETTYHIYFRRTGPLYNPDRGSKTRCIYDEDFKDRLMIDALYEWKTGTPHIIKVPQGTKKKRFLHQPLDIIPLPEEVINYFDTHWYNTPSEREHMRPVDKWIRLLSVLPDGYHFNGGRFYHILHSLRLLGVKYQDVYKWSKTLKQSKECSNHDEWLRKTWFTLDMTDISNRDGFVIVDLVKREAEEEFHKVWNDFLGVPGEDFDPHDLSAFAHARLPLVEKRSKLIKYYNHFFLVSTGGAEPSIYKKIYDANGILTDVIELKGAILTQKKFYGVDMTLYDDGDGDTKKINTYEWWFSLRGDAWYTGVYFEPYGINYSPEEVGRKKKYFNTFAGYKMKKVINYQCDDVVVRALGERIFNHVHEVWCNKDMNLTISLLGWLRRLVVIGKQTKLMVVLYSSQHGSGKSMWWEYFLEQVIGDKVYSKTADLNTLIGNQFTEGIMDKVLCMVEEIPQFKWDGSRGSSAIWSKLKSYVTDKIQQGMKKYKGTETFESFLNIIGLTNNPNCCHPEMFFRRTIGLAISNHRVGDGRYHQELAEALERYDAWEYFIHTYLIKNRDVIERERSMKACPQWLDKYANTEFRKMSLKKSVSSFISFWCEMVEIWKAESSAGTLDHMIGTHSPISTFINKKGDTISVGLFEQYEQYCNKSGAYCLTKCHNQFITKMNEAFEIRIEILRGINEDMPLATTATADLFQNTGNRRKVYGEYIIWTADRIKRLEEVCAKSFQDKDIYCDMDAKDIITNMKTITEEQLEFYEDDDPF